jgi:hypothetical protein
MSGKCGAGTHVLRSHMAVARVNAASTQNAPP